MRIYPGPHWTDERVRLFPLTVDRVSEAYVSWLNDPEINRLLESRFTVQSRASVEEFVKNAVRSEKDLLLGIHDLQLDRHVGNIKLGPIDRHHGLGEIGLMIGDRAAWGRGLATSAISIIAEVGFVDLALRKLTAGCYATNVGSRRAFEKAGFRIEGVRPDHFILDGVPEDLILLARLRTDDRG